MSSNCRTKVYRTKDNFSSHFFAFEKSLRGVYSSGYMINFSCMSSQAVINNVFIVLEIKIMICISKEKIF